MNPAPRTTTRLGYPATITLACIVLCTPVCAQTIGAGQSGRGAFNKKNLDLPHDSGLGGIISLYGQQLEGDGFFFTIDRSGSMQDSGELQRAKDEVIRSFAEFSEHTEFAVNFFDAGIVKFPQDGKAVKASGGMAKAAMAWIASIPGGAGSCCQQGFAAALFAANGSSAQRQVIVYVGDGGGTCHGREEDAYLEETLTLVDAQNYRSLRIHTIGVMMNGRAPKYTSFLKRVAQTNSGVYKAVN